MKNKKKKTEKSIISLFLICVFILSSAAFLLSGIIYAGSMIENRLNGSQPEFISLDDIKRGCFEKINMIEREYNKLGVKIILPTGF